MKKSLPVVSKCALIVLIFSITLMPVFSFSESLEEESSGEITLEQIEGELAAEDTDPISSEEDEEQEETISEPEKLVPSKEAEPAAMTVTMDSLVPPSPEEAIFSAAPHMAIPDVSMKIGSLVMKYPIQVPPGRNNTAPVISLNYNSSRGNGIAGVGWELNTSAIRRSTRKGLSYSGTQFTYDGEDLVPVSVDASGYGTYRPEKEQFFSIIEFLQTGSGTEDFWRVTFKNGRIHTFGSQADARQESTEGTSIWYLAEVADTFGNTIDYTYENDSGSRVRPSSISWVDSFYTVSFFYETRSDIISDCSSHSNVQTPSRLKTITVTSNSGLENVRAYALEYAQSMNTGRSLLEVITLFGSDFGLDTDNTVISGSSMPPTRISYAGHLKSYRPGPDGIDGDLSSGQELTNTYEYPAVTGDFNGDGKADIGRTKDSVLQCYVSTGTGFETISSLSDLSKGQGFDNAYEHPLVSGDWNGDGKTDVGRLGQSSSVFYISTGTGFSSFVTLSALSCSNGFTNVDEYPVFTGDFNGDGKTDIGRVSNSGIVIYRSTGSGFQSVTGISDLGKTAFPNNNEMPVVIGDFNGDGRIDIGRVNNTGIRIYLALEDGFTLFPGGGLSGLGKTLFPDFKEHPIITGDFNGDGLTDIGRAGTSGLITYLSTGTGFVTGPQITNDFGKDDYPTYNEYPIFTGDFNDDGLTDVGRVSDSGIVLYRSTGTAFARYGNDIGALSPGYGFATQSENPLFTGDYSGTGPSGIARISDSGVEVYSPAADSSADPQGPSDLAAEVIYSTGSETHISYTPSSAYSNTLMPFVMQCVSHTVTEDGLGGTAATSYSYSGGLYDYSERELRSFAQVIKTLPDGTKKTFTFHQDRFLDGMIQSIEHRDPDDTLLSDTENTWEAVPFDADSAFIRLNEQIDTFYENEKTVVSNQTFTYDDTHGSILARTLTGTGLDAPVTTAYEYAYYGNGGTYPLKTVRQTLFSEIPEDFTRRTEYDYQTGTGFLIQETAVNRTGISPVTQYGCDLYGNVSSVTDPMGNTTTYTYDGLTHTYLVRIDKPLTGTDLVEHVLLYPEQDLDYRFGKPGRFTNENGFDTTYGYDLFGRIAQIDTPDGGRELFTYTDQFDTDAYIPRSVVKQVKDGESQGEATYIRTIAYVDGFNRTIQTVEKSRIKHVISLFSYDNMGRQDSVRGPFVRVEDTTAYLHAMRSAMPDSLSLVTDALWSRTHYDTRNRVVRIDSGGGITTQMVYDGLKVTVTDPDGNQTSQITDILGRIAKVIEHIPDGTERDTDYHYNIAGDLVRVSRQNPATLMPVENTVTYDTLGRKTEMIDPDTGTWEYTYDLNGNLKTRKDSRDVLLTFEYDELNRLTRKIYPDLSFAEYEYDAGLNGTGLLYSRTNASGTAATTFSAYDEQGRVSSETRRVDNTSVVFDYAYDPAGRPFSKTINQDGNLLNMFTYEFYQGTRLLYRVEDLSGLAYAEITQYSPQGKIEAIAYGNQAVLVNYGYSGVTGRLDSIFSYRTTDFIPITGKIYEYSKAGDITLISDTLNDRDRIYAYDHAHRLILETTRGEGAEAGTEVEVIEFTYGDEESNPEDYPLNAPSQIRVETTQNGTTTEKFREYSYLASGNRSNKTAGIENTFYESDPDNMISRITVNGTETLFSYDADGRRVKKQQGLASTLYFGENLEIINGTATLYLFAGNLRIGMIRNSTVMFYVKDHLGSTDALVRDDGLIIASTDYMPFGLDRESNTLLQTTAYKFTDQEQDAETGLYNYDARLYDPFIGQFIMADTIVPDPFNPQSLNRYAYCLNNPIRYIDPSGHWGGDPDANGLGNGIAGDAGVGGGDTGSGFGGGGDGGSGGGGSGGGGSGGNGGNGGWGFGPGGHTFPGMGSSTPDGGDGRDNSWDGHAIDPISNQTHAQAIDDFFGFVDFEPGVAVPDPFGGQGNNSTPTTTKNWGAIVGGVIARTGALITQAVGVGLIGIGIIEEGLLETPHCFALGTTLYGAGEAIDRIGKNLIDRGWNGNRLDFEKSKNSTGH